MKFRKILPSLVFLGLLVVSSFLVLTRIIFVPGRPDDPLTSPRLYLPETPPGSSPSPTPETSPVIRVPTPAPPATERIDKKLLILIFNPRLTSQGNRKLTEYKNWHDPDLLTEEAVSWLKEVSLGRVNYAVVEREEESVFLRKEDGFLYTEEAYLECSADVNKCHFPDTADYRKIIESHDVCGKFNRGEIDELWLFGGPWFGFYESRLAGPQAFSYNSPPLTATACRRLLPIMGYSYERALTEMIHDYGHRAEATLTKVYGDRAENNIRHNFNKFGLTKVQSPDYGFSGCGSIHFPPNALKAYQYDNAESADSYCGDFGNYPLLSANPLQVLKKVDCRDWNCTEIGFYGYWFKHLPAGRGMGPDGKLNDWLLYIFDVNKVGF